MAEPKLPKIIMEVTAEKVGFSYVKNFRNEADCTLYMVPTYRMNLYVEGKTEPVATYEVIRYGIAKRPNGDAYVCGLSAEQTRKVTGWHPEYQLVSQILARPAAWFLGGKGEYRVHAGPVDPHSLNLCSTYGALGCIEVVGLGQWDALNNAILEASGFGNVATQDERNDKLSTIAKNLSVTFLPATAPRLYRYDQWQTFENQVFPGGLPDPFQWYPSSYPNFLDSILGTSGLAPWECVLFGGRHSEEEEEEEQSPPSSCGTRSLAAPKTEGEKPRPDPLVLDLDGDGIQTTRQGRPWSEGRAFFDHNADGFAVRTGWVSGNDGLLVWDRNGDGIINDGRELFGSGTMMSGGRQAIDGFQAPGNLDKNHDGKIDAQDEWFLGLQICQDACGHDLLTVGNQPSAISVATVLNPRRQEREVSRWT